MYNLEKELIEVFKNDDTFIKYNIRKEGKLLAKIFYIEGLVNIEKVGEIIIKKFEDENSIYLFPNVKILTDINEIVDKIINGSVIVFDYQKNNIVNLEIRSFFIRGINEPDNEKNIKGPREGLIENIIVNTHLIRNRIKRNDLKIEYNNVNSDVHCKIAVMYLNKKVNSKALRVLRQRIKNITKINAIDTNLIKEQIKDHKYNPFNTIGDTQRPDVCATKLLEGKIILLLEGSPNALYLPFLFSENFQTIDDYYTNFYYGSLNRFFRFVSFLITILFPGIYVSLLMFHQELIPVKLLLSISASRKGVPFPTFFECVLLLTVFEVLREASTKSSGLLGNSLSIVGAIVIGQSAVEARIVSTSVVIVVAATSITSLINPKLTGAAIIFRYFLLLLGTVLGLYGLLCGLLFIAIYLVKMKSFGGYYISKIMSFNIKDYKKTYMRVPND